MNAIARLLINGKIKVITVSKTDDKCKSWLCQMSKNKNFLYGELEDGSFAIADTRNMDAAKKAELL